MLDRDQPSDPRREQAHSPVGLALLCACLISIGSHYSVWQIGALRPTLGSPSDFASSVVAIELSNTVTPLLAGSLIPRFGAGRSAVAATAANALGQAIVLFARPRRRMGAMLLGLFVSGTAAAPLSVIQESVIVSMASSGRNTFLALGLIAGKTTAFLASIAALPLNDHFGVTAPFAVSLLLALVSLVAALIFLWIGKTEPDPADRSVDSTRIIPLRELVQLGDAVSIYYAVCAVSGALWFTTVHLAPDILRTLFEISPQSSATLGSVVLVTPIALYLPLGRLLDRSDGSAVFRLFVATSMATLVTYPLLLAPVAGPLLSLVPFALGYGASPLLLVASVPHIVSTRYVSTVLGLHKATEMSGAIVMQTGRAPRDGQSASDPS